MKIIIPNKIFLLNLLPIIFNYVIIKINNYIKMIPSYEIF